MGRKSKISGIKIIEVIEEYLRGEDSLNHLAEMLNVSWTNNLRALLLTILRNCKI